MNRRSITWLVALAIVVTAAACGPKKAKTGASDISSSTVSAPSSAPTTDVAPKSRPAVNDAQDVNPLNDPDLAKLNSYVTSQGLLGDVYFDYDKADLGDSARDRLSRNAEWLKAHPEFEVTVEGHCDERGTNEYNLALGERRASASRDYIGSLGVSGGRIRTITYGEERPLCTVSDEGCWSQNRRAHFVITGRTNVG